jgi:hypothetical protein
MKQKCTMLATEKRVSASNNQLIRGAILMYWSIFWLFNIVDKVIGGSMFLWVGRDRFAQFQKYFASAGLEAPVIADIALIVAAALEIFAFVFMTGALVFYLKSRLKEARSWFLMGILLTLVTFTLFSLGDHLFGDRFELLEHTLFWFMTIASWVIFIRLEVADKDHSGGLSRPHVIVAAVVAGCLVMITSLSIFNYNDDYFYRRTASIAAEPVGEDLFKVSFPFLGGSTVFEKTIAQFIEEHPTKRIDHIYTVPNPLRLKKADALIFYIITEEKP